MTPNVSSPEYDGYPTTSTPASSGSSSAGLYASMGLSAVGAITNAFSQSAAIKAQGDYEANISKTNAAIANLQSSQALEAGDIAASRKNLQTKNEVGSELATQGASGVDVASGSSALIRSATTGSGAIDALTIKNNAARQAWGYQTEAIEDSYKGQFAQLTAKSESTQSLITGGLSAVSGPLAIESNYLRWSRYMGGGSGSNSSGVPFPNMSTN